MDLFKFIKKCAVKLRCPDTKDRYDKFTNLGAFPAKDMILLMAIHIRYIQYQCTSGTIKDVTGI